MPNQELTQDQKSMKTLGICVMIIAGIDILASIITFIKPSTLGYLNDALANTGIDVGILTALPPFSVPTSMLVPMPQPSVSPEACSQANCGVARSYSTVSILS